MTTADDATDGAPYVEQGSTEYRVPVPTGRQLRKITASAADARTGSAGIGSLLNDVYYAVISAAIALAVIIGVANNFRESMPEPTSASNTDGLSIGSMSMLFLIAVGGGILSMSSRLGPVGLGGAQSSWWLPTPVDRRSLLRPSTTKIPLLAGAVGIAAAIVFGSLGGFVTSVPNAIWAALAGGFGAAALAFLAGVLQGSKAGRRIAITVGDGLVLVAPVLGVVATFTGYQLSTVPAVTWYVAAIAVVLAIGLGMLVDRRLGKLRGADLRERGAVAEHASGSVSALDSRELGRALTETARRARRRFSLKFRWVGSAASALIASDLILLVRSPRHVVQIIGAACVPIIVTHVSNFDQPIIVFLVLIVSGYTAMLATAEGARRAEMNPSLDRMVPLDASRVRLMRMVVPGLAMLLWSIVSYYSISLSHDGSPSWLLLGVLATPVWAAAAVRSAYRASPDWSGQLVSTPAGALPPGVMGAVSKGPEIAVLGSIPVGIALLTGQVPSMMYFFQILASIVAVMWAKRTKGLMESMQAQAAEAEKLKAEQKRLRGR